MKYASCPMVLATLSLAACGNPSLTDADVSAGVDYIIAQSN